MKEILLDKSKTADETFAGWLERFLAELIPLERSFGLAVWRANTSGRKEDEARLERAERAYRSLFANPERYRFLRSLCEKGELQDPLLQRQAKLLRSEFEANQMDDYTLRRMVSLRIEIESLYNNFRAELGGEKVTENRLREILRKGERTDEVRAAWEAAKQIGPRVAPRILELVALRNSVARAIGYENYQRMSLTLDEIDPDWLFRLLEELERATLEPYRLLRKRLDASLAKRFGIQESELAPWHFGDPFFQSAPRTGSVDLDEFYRGADLSGLTVRFYDGLGLEIRAIVDESDLFEREGKCQHAFCTDIDRRGDVRVLCNLKSNEQWMGTMLHEFGHAVYDAEFDPELPHLLRGPAHTLTTEAIAMMFGRASKDRRFLAEVVGVSAEKAREASASAREELRAEQLIFIRWALVVVHFERELYRDPAQDLNRLWWDLVERYQEIRRPEGRNEPDWATKTHIATSPIYYQNYILGELTAAQLQVSLLGQVAPGEAGRGGAEPGAGVGGLLGRREIGDFLRERVFRPGRRRPWPEMIEQATGAPLTVAPFLKEITGGGR